MLNSDSPIIYFSKNGQFESFDLDVQSTHSSDLGVFFDSVGVDTKVLLARVSPAEYEDFCLSLAEIRGHYPHLVVLVESSGLSIEHIQNLVNEQLAYAIFDDKEQRDKNIKIALDEYNARLERSHQLKLLRSQNEKLENLKENLENHVYQRTLNELKASVDAESSLKQIQSLLHFVKVMARSYHIEDLVEELGYELRRSELLTPPILLIKRNGTSHLYYFQGRQVVGRLLEGMSQVDSIFHPQDNQSLRTQLTEVLGRPVGQVGWHQLTLHSRELESTEAIVILEHGSRTQDLERQQFFEQRWSIFALALESILLRESVRAIAKQWSNTFNQMSDPILILDTNYKIRSSNKQFDLDKEKHCYEVFANRDKPCANCPLNKTIQSDSPQVSDVSLDGKIFRVHSFPIHLDETKASSHVIHQYVDVTHSVSLRSQVVQGEKMAAVGLLAGNIAHELNNPLTGIRSLSELMLLDLEPATTTYKDLSEVRDASIRCQQIIRDLLEFSSLGSEAQTKTIDLNDVVSKTLPLLKVAMRMINTDVQLSESPARVRANPQLIQQVVFNLVNNACQAMAEGGDLLVRVREDDLNCEILVRDSGEGIPEELRDRIFEPFFTTKEDGKGTGLGLSLSRSIVERFGGELNLTQGLEHGTEFVLRLPKEQS